MKKLALSILLGILVILPLWASAAESGFVYPFAEIAKPSCRKEAWSTLGPDCKMPLPRIAWAEYSKFTSDNALRRVYSVLWGATYDYGWDMGLGSHLGVDIVTSAGTPVQSIGAGKVINAGWGAGWGNYITIEHTLTDGTKIWSNYGHLSSIAVAKGDTAIIGQKIGEVGNTGNSYGNHLHFQIDITDQLHPYYYVRCGTGKNPINIVNTGDCRSSLTDNTIDPIAFLETGARIQPPVFIPGTPAPTIPTAPTSATIETIKSKPLVMIDRTRIKSREELLEEEATEYLKSHRITVKLPDNGTILRSGITLGFEIESRDLGGALVTSNLPGPGITIQFDTRKVSVFPEKINILEGGQRALSLTPRGTGETVVTFMYGRTFIGQKKLSILARTEQVTTRNVELRSPRTLTLGAESDMYVSPLTPSGAYVGGNFYPERYRLEVTKGKAKFCLDTPIKWVNCDPSRVVESLEFTAKDTPLGYLATELVPLTPWELEFRVSLLQWGRWNSIKTQKVTVKLPLRLTRSYQYYDAVIASMGRNVIKTSWGFVGAEQGLTTSTAGALIDRALAWQILRAWADTARKNKALESRARFTKLLTTLPERTISRGEFASITLDALNIPGVKRDPVWTDESGVYLQAMTTLRTKYSFSWQDSFGLTYFQPDKTIERGEATYMLEVVLGR